MLQTIFTEFRQHAKAYFDAVKKGGAVQVIRHGKIIAEISPATNEEQTLSWKKPGLKLPIKGASLTKTILKERKTGK